MANLRSLTTARPWHPRATRRANLTALVVAALLITLGPGPPAHAADAPPPRVALIVGPVGSVTGEYISLAREAARAARKAGAIVVEAYSPAATWPAVRRATAGASIVVYLGHGNGWPSQYRDRLFPPTQNGFGLNPVDGGGNDAHQYFGEASVEGLDLAPGAVVLLHRLCYASGNSEPGLAEGTRDDAVARVDNFAAGFIRAGARAVVAEGHLGPAYYVRALLVSRLSLEQIWDRSPTAHGNTFAVASARSPGFTELLDPDRASGGYYRSLVTDGIRAAEVRAGAVRGPGPGAHAPSPPVVPSLVADGVAFGSPTLRDLPIAGTKSRLLLPASGTASPPPGVQIGVRWDPILVDPPLPSPAPGGSPAPAPSSPSVPRTSPGTAASPTPSASPGPSPSASPSAAPQVPDASPTPPDAPQIDLVVPEQVGSLVTPAKAKPTKTGLAVGVTYPPSPGLYRLVITLHAPSGVAYDAASQELVVPLLVRVGGPVTVAYGAPAAVTVPARSTTTVPVRIVNAGSEAWDLAGPPPAPADPKRFASWVRGFANPADLVATWVSVAGQAVPAPVAVSMGPDIARPGGSGTLPVELTAPAEPGTYLLLFDVVSPALGPLSAFGSDPAIVRVVVGPPNAPVPEPDPAARYPRVAW